MEDTYFIDVIQVIEVTLAIVAMQIMKTMQAIRTLPITEAIFVNENTLAIKTT